MSGPPRDAPSGIGRNDAPRSAAGPGQEATPDSAAHISPLDREWVAALAHEMRSPIGAVTGYAELICDSVLGPVGPDVADAVARMNRAAEQMLILIQGLEDAALISEGVSDIPADVPLAELMHEAAELFRFDLESRNGSIDVVTSALTVCTRRVDALRALRLAVSAAARSGAATSIRLRAEPAADGGVAIRISGAGISAVIDEPAPRPPGTRLSGAAFRITLARAALARCGGLLQISGEPVEITLSLPPLSPS
jgi:signal transduction histidine kinase